MNLFKQLTEKENQALLKFPAYISLLATNSDSKPDKGNKMAAIKLSYISTFSSNPLLAEFYTEADKMFKKNVAQLDKDLPQEKDSRDAAIKKELLNLEKIVLKLGKEYTSTILEFNQLLLTNAEFLKPFAITLTNDDEQAKDLFQDTLCRALINKDKFNIGSNIKAWLYTIMKNIFINNYRTKAKHHVILDNTSNDFIFNLNHKAIADDTLSMINVKEVDMYIHELPDMFRIPFMLYYDGFKYQEISDIMNAPLGTIKSRIFIARKLLKDQMEKYGNINHINQVQTENSLHYC